MTTRVESRCIELGQYIVDNNTTVRSTAEKFGISKSTVHIDVTRRLKAVSPTLAREVYRVLQSNKAVRHIRGGEATKEKYQRMKND